MKLFGYELLKKSDDKPTKERNVVASVVFVESNGRILYEFRNGQNEPLRFTDVNPRLLFPLVASIERFFWLDDYSSITEDEIRDWWTYGSRNMQNGDPTPFYDAYKEVLDKRDVGREFR